MNALDTTSGTIETYDTVTRQKPTRLGSKATSRACGAQPAGAYEARDVEARRARLVVIHHERVGYNPRSPLPSTRLRRAPRGELSGQGCLNWGGAARRRVPLKIDPSRCPVLTGVRG